MEGTNTRATWLSLAVAAMVGASVAATSAFLLHRRALEQIKAKIEVESGHQRSQERKHPHHVVASRQRKVARDAACLDNKDDRLLLESPSNGTENGKSVLDYSTPRPAIGLPHLQIKQGGSNILSRLPSMQLSRPVAGIIRPTTPKSPVHSTIFEDMESSEEEDQDLQELNDEDEQMIGANGDVNMKIKPNSEEVYGLVKSPIPENISSAELIRCHSISGEIHGMHAPNPIAADILRKEPEQETFVRLNVTPIEAPSAEEDEVCSWMQECLALREKYVFREEVHPWKKHEITDPSTPKPNPNPFHYVAQLASSHVYKMVDGVVRVYASEAEKEELFPVYDATTFFTDMHQILKIIALGNVRTLCHHRLRFLEQKFSIHLMLNADREFLAQKSAPHRDFYNVRKVDTHVHHSSCMNQKHLLRFIKSKLRKEPDEIVIFRDGKYLTLKEVFESLDLTGYDLNVDLLDVHADKNTFHRFDKFNLKYNPFGQSRLREIFLKQDNLIQGRFLAELTKEVFSDLAASKYQMAEYRISIYGREQSEWDKLASWIVNNELYSENVTWLIQLPRLYQIYKEMGILGSFENILENMFMPLFEVTVNPSSHPQLHVFLEQVVGFDMVDDESKSERRPTKHMPTPAQWNNPFNPAYSYWAYYVYANLYILNKLREAKGMSTIKFRPHAGEAGELDHLAATFLLAHNIAHGNNLRKSPGLQYLYYLAQIGLAMSPLSNNHLFLDYHRNPFPVFFARGLNVSLSTDDPLQIHFTKEPLVEEYSIAAQVWKLSSCDLCEIARNSVHQSGFHHSFKSHWIGMHYFKRGPDGNDIHKTNVPRMRVEFRHEVWKEEMNYVYLGKAKISDEFMP
ncbi:unnamed protein product [Sphagnum jensenii]|uniref:AMP deaminase n=1 Tax=Sphagnum jensenii TaxID=128206 RepID=A0ABP0X0I3_9BRYO